jgi:hypothetical protein
MITLANSPHRVSFCTLAGVAEVQCVGDSITGRWADSPKTVGGNAVALVTDFANWPTTPEAVLKFTSKYGPLEERRSIGVDDKGRPFQFELRAWRAKQQEFQSEWHLYNKLSHIPSSGSWIQVSPQEAFLRRGFGLEYRAENLWRFLLFSLDSLPSKRLRACKRPDCTHPYFVAGHLKQTFCSDGCAEWGQKQWKLKWWAEHGDEWRKKRLSSKPSKKSQSRRGK